MNTTHDRVKWVTGIDEVGRGCLAGPVVVASVQFEQVLFDRLPWRDDLKDSKVLSAKQRNRLYPLIVGAARSVRVACISHILVDYMNILRATLHGFELVCPPYHPSNRVSIDGNQKPTSLKWASTVIGGDGKLPAISAASVIAKTVRDQLMARLARAYPDYGFERHVGYGTQAHLLALNATGPSPWHRKSFRPVLKATRPCQRAERTMNEMLDGVVCPERAWSHFHDQYHHFSLETCRAMVDQLQELGLCVLPTRQTLQPVFL